MKGVSLTPVRRFFRRLRGNHQIGFALTKKSRRLLKVIAALIALLLIFMFVTAKIYPFLDGIADSSVQNAVTIEINRAVSEKMNSGELGYETLVTLSKDESGAITAITSNIVNINRLQSELIEIITRRVKDSKTSVISIPIGNMTGSPFLSGRGPSIKFHIISVNSVSASFSSEFTSAGINQTRHRILLEVRVRVSVLVPGAISQSSVAKQIVVAETVIVGKVPGTYAYFGAGGQGDDAALNSNIQKYNLIR